MTHLENPIYDSWVGVVGVFKTSVSHGTQTRSSMSKAFRADGLHDRRARVGTESRRAWTSSEVGLVKNARNRASA